jgi:hypothetical protein
MSNDFRTALERWRDLADTDLLCPENPAETDWGAVVVAIAATRAALAQSEGQSSLNVNLTIDTSPENLKRLCDGLAAAVTPNGGYEAATTDDPAPGTGADQMVQVQWWIPQHGCDSLENTLDGIKHRIGRVVTDWWATALVPANQPDVDSLTDDDLLQFAVQKLGLLRAPSAETLVTLDAGELPSLLRAALTRWGRPAAPPVLATQSVSDQQREAVRAAVAEALGDTYDCTRVWEAWGVGTMGPDDFVLVAEDGDRVAEIADAVIEALRPAAPAAREVWELTTLFAVAASCGGGARLSQDQCARTSALLAQLSAAPPAPEPAPNTSAEALAARQLLQEVARIGDVIGQQTVGDVRRLADQAAAWLRENPPGQPVAIEPKGCPTPGAWEMPQDCGHGLPGVAIRGGASWFTPDEMEAIEAMEAHNAIPLPQAREVEA